MEITLLLSTVKEWSFGQDVDLDACAVFHYLFIYVENQEMNLSYSYK
jgi:hypothetical protein